ASLGQAGPCGGGELGGAGVRRGGGAASAGAVVRAAGRRGAVVRAAAARRGESAWNPAVRGEPMSGLAALAVGVGAVEVGASGAIGLRVVRGEARARGRHPPAVATRRGRGRALQ